MHTRTRRSWVCWKMHNVRRTWQGLPPYNATQWAFTEALQACAILERRLYFVIAAGATYDRSPEALTEFLAIFDADEQVSLGATPDMVRAAYQALISKELCDADGRPRMLYDLVP